MNTVPKHRYEEMKIDRMPDWSDDAVMAIVQYMQFNIDELKYQS